jgi:hypothetical protein
VAPAGKTPRLIAAKSAAHLQRACRTGVLPWIARTTKACDRGREVKDISASENQRAEGFDGSFWERLFRLEGRRVRAKHDGGRGLEGLPAAKAAEVDEAEELRRAWCRYSEVIAELEQPGSESEPPQR